MQQQSHCNHTLHPVLCWTPYPWAIAYNGHIMGGDLCRTPATSNFPNSTRSLDECVWIRRSGGAFPTSPNKLPFFKKKLSTPLWGHQAWNHSLPSFLPPNTPIGSEVIASTHAMYFRFGNKDFEFLDNPLLLVAQEALGQVLCSPVGADGCGVSLLNQESLRPPVLHVGVVILVPPTISLCKAGVVA